MSFSGRVKEELAVPVSAARHCQLAELAAILAFNSRIGYYQEGPVFVRIQSENIFFIRKCFTLLVKAFNINSDVVVRSPSGGRGGRSYFLYILGAKECRKVLQAVKMWGYSEDQQNQDELVSSMVVARACCKRAFIRGAFLGAGSVSDPHKSYHLEFVCTTEKKAKQLKAVIHCFGVDARITSRKKYFVVYIKDGAGIVDMLNIMEAHIALMDLENLRIVKEMRNSVNRKVNCETANIGKTVSAAVKQLQNIQYIQSTAGLWELPDHLQRMAEVRLEYPDASLKELGEKMNPKVGKSGVNHRLRKIGEFADLLREQRRSKF